LTMTHAEAGQATEHVHSHLCLISGQPTPNLTPLLDRAFRPEKAIFLVSPDMNLQAEWLKQAVQPSGVGVRFHRIDDAWDIEHVHDRVLALLEETGMAGIALNATGGTKPMSIAAYEVFRGLDLPIFYVHPQTDRVVWMHPADRPGFGIEDRVRLPQFLQAHGVTLLSRNRTVMPVRRRELVQDLVDGISRFSEPLGTLNYLAGRAEGGLRVEVPEKKRGWSDLTDLIGLFADAGLLQQEGAWLLFPDEEARFFVNGGWLEHHVFFHVKNLARKTPAIHDMAQGVEVRRGQVRNELDVAFLHNNRLHLIECKTRQLRQGGADAVYKLDSLTDALGGLKARAMLVSYRQPNDADLRRARQAGIRVCTGVDLLRLGDILHNWIAAE